MGQMLISSGAVLALGILVLWWARACRNGTLPRNWLFGYRTAVTLKDKAAWDAVNRASAPFITIAGCGLLLGAVLGASFALLGLTGPFPTIVGGSFVWLVAWVLAAIVPAVRAERAYRQGLGKA
ncbi:MAG: SdpI family protein [Microbacteriaceae bacterium]